MKEHEKALRIFVHNIGDFSEAEEYCNQMTEGKAATEKQKLLLLFLTVLLDLSEQKNSRWDLWLIHKAYNRGSIPLLKNSQVEMLRWVEADENSDLEQGHIFHLLCNTCNRCHNCSLFAFFKYLQVFKAWIKMSYSLNNTVCQNSSCAVARFELDCL